MAILQRVTPNCSELFADIEHLLMNRFLPSLFGHGYTPHKHVLYSLPICMGGLNVRNPVTSSDHAYSASRSAVHLLVWSIIEQQPFCPIDHCFHVQHSKLEHSSLMKSINNDIFDTVIEQFDKYHQQAILRSKDTLFSWLSALPIQKDHFDLTANEFRDALWELRKVEVVPIVVGALGAVTENIEKWIKNLGITVRLEHLQKTALLGTARIIRRHLNTEN